MKPRWDAVEGIQKPFHGSVDWPRDELRRPFFCRNMPAFYHSNWGTNSPS